MKDDVAYDLVTVKRARGGVIRRERLAGREISVKSQFRVEPNDFLMSKRQIVHGACGLVPSELAGSIVSNEYAVLTTDGGLDLRFLLYLSNSPYFQQTCFHSSIGVHVEKMIFKLDRWLRWEFDLPPLPEQKKIAEILSTWDKAIETTEKLLANAEAQKQALMQQLLTGKQRLRGFETRPWRKFRLDELAHINPGRSRDLPGYVTFVRMEQVSEQGDLLSPQIRPAEEMSAGYTPFAEGDVLVAKITPCFENGKGCHAVGLEGGIGFGSTEFHVLRAFDPNDQRLLYHITRSHHFRAIGASHMTGSAGQKRVPAGFVASYLVDLPSEIEERKELSSVLDLARDAVVNLQGQGERLVAEKSALMQQLLSGKRRVKI